MTPLAGCRVSQGRFRTGFGGIFDEAYLANHIGHRATIMLFAVIRLDKPNSLALRTSERPKHLDYLKSVLTKIVYGGALLDGGKQIGSMLIIDVADQAEADAFADNDPFVAAELFAQTTVHPFRPVFRDGAWL